MRDLLYRINQSVSCSCKILFLLDSLRVQSSLFKSFHPVTIAKVYTYCFISAFFSILLPPYCPPIAISHNLSMYL